MKRIFANLITLSVFIGVTYVPPAFSYDPPVGIKNPDWGSIHPIDTQAPSRPAGWPGREVAGYYYYDNTAPNCSDSNTYGYPDVPKCSLASDTTFPAGSYVEVHGGPYYGSYGTKLFFKGTEANPVWFRGESVAKRPELNGNFRLFGSYVFFENLLFTPNSSSKSIYINVGYTGYSIHHASFRHIEAAGKNEQTSNSTSVFMVQGPDATDKSHDIVFYDMHIHDLGDWQSAEKKDYIGIRPDKFSKNIWVLNSSIHHMGGDSMQVGLGTYTAANRPEYVWIGGNTFHDDLENAVDIKTGNHIILASNEMYGYKTAPESHGEVVLTHEGPIDNVWIVNNKIHAGHVGITMRDTTNIYVLGNLLYEMYTLKAEKDWGPGAWSEGTAIRVSDDTVNNAVIVGNTLYNYNVGIGIAGSGPGGVDIRNNIITGRNFSTGLDMAFEGSTAIRGTTDYNLMHSADGFRIKWNNTIYSSLAMFKSGTGECDNCIDNDPLFTATGTDFTPQADSPARDTGFTHSAYDLFKSTYGVSIKKDMVGTVIPQNSTWDIGAYEYTDSRISPDLDAPAGLSASSAKSATN